MRSLIVLPVLLALLIIGCAGRGDVNQPIPTRFHPAAHPGKRLVVVLPGRGDGVDTFARHRVAELIQQQWPDADVLLTELTLRYYMQGRAMQRLQDEVIAPQLQRGQRELWIVGNSLGGMGAILYQHEYPQLVRGVLLLSPYLGGRAIQKAVEKAGGIGRWQAGPRQPLTSDNYQHAIWWTIDSWASDTASAVWVAYGESEKLSKSIALMAPAVPPSQVLPMPGKHNWTLWVPALTELLQRADQHLGPRDTNDSVLRSGFDS